MSTERLRLCRGLALIPADDRLIVLGAPRRYVLSGSVATATLPKLAALLDGTRDRQRIAAELDLDPARLARILTLLDQRGLVESAAAPSTDAVPANQVTSYYSRNLSVSGGYRGTGELVDALSEVAVHVAGDEGVTAAIAEDLLGCGILSVGTGVGPPTGSAASRLERARRPLVIAVDDAAAPEFGRRIVSWCEPRGVPVLRVAAYDGYLEIGPTLLGGTPACLACLHNGRTQADWRPMTAGAPAGDAVDALAGLVGTEALAIAAGFPGGRAPHIIRRIAINEWTTEERLVVPDPDCATCWPGSDQGTPDRDTWLAESYERAKRVAPERLAVRSEPDPAERKRIGALQSDRPEFPTHPRVRLDDALTAPGGVPAGLGTLATVLRRVAGLRRDPGGPELRRWAPTGGNMASVELYLITESGVPGLPGTVFRYADLTDELIAIRPDPVPLSDALAGTDLDRASVTAALVFVAAAERLAAKYDDFAHRLAHLDAGCATTQLTVVAHEFGQAVTFASGWDERLSELFGLAVEDQFVSAVAGLGPTEGGA